MSAVQCNPSPLGLLIHCATTGANSWGGKRRVWAAFAYNGDMLHWSASKRSCRAMAGKQSKSFILCKLQGIEPHKATQ